MPAADDVRFALEMTLLAHGVAQPGPQMFGVDDGVVGAGRGVPIARILDVRPAGAVAALAADCVTLRENRFRKMIGRPFRRRGAVTMTEQALIADLTEEKQLLLVIPRSQVPILLARIPANRRLEEKAAIIHEVGPTLSAGAERELNRALDGLAADLSQVDQFLAAALDAQACAVHYPGCPGFCFRQVRRNQAAHGQ